MFRGCDSSFALGSAGKEDEVGWFSVSDAIEGSEDASKSDFKLSCPDSNALTNLSEDIEPSRLKNESSSVNDSNMKNTTVSYKTSSQRSEIDEPASLSHLSSVNGYDQISESQDDFILRDQVSDSLVTFFFLGTRSLNFSFIMSFSILLNDFSGT